jgi:hypothetical protein
MILPLKPKKEWEVLLSKFPLLSASDVIIEMKEKSYLSYGLS